MNHFEMFNLPVQFALDSADLQKRYRQLQQTLHPDRFANASERDRLLAVQRSSQLNDAYSTLREPLARAEYLLHLQGIDLAHEQTTLRDPEFLMAQMEWRERLEELEQLLRGRHLSPDGLSACPLAVPLALERAEKDLEAEAQQLFQQLEQALAEQQYEAAAILIRKLKFMAKLRIELEGLEDQL
ncbi:Fe-S protein assembly co-chaperone HscB [Pseudidiomarina mangrovi]|uniref:Fe-S protein assembly co-chaperone HscB n=1 Tax=Pseudidiomarina mangrovi TaxID=2487133 RepID=UPI000FCB70DA|nr:Fe-S protein assembly co-chaperone HscB [Pseudidiomarina mangrovi]